MTMRVQLAEFCGSRSGDKGDISDLTLFADDEVAYQFIVEAVTADIVKEHYGAFVTGHVDRYEAPNVWGLKFVMHGALGGGCSRTLRSDSLGKTFGPSLLRIWVDAPDHVIEASARRERPEVARA
jgi:hypothetical protein